MEITLKTLAPGVPHSASVDSPEFVIGRSSDCDLRLNSPIISRRHCVLTIQDDAVYVRDLKSSYGTGVNNQPLVGERPLRDGDILWVAATPVEVRIRRDQKVASRVKRFAEAAWQALRPPNESPGPSADAAAH